MEVGCSSLSQKKWSRGGWLCPFRGFSVPAEGPGAELVSGACNAAREDGPGMAGGDALATGYATAEPQACKQARESFGRAASGAPSQRVLAALVCASGASLAACPHAECQPSRHGVVCAEWTRGSHFVPLSSIAGIQNLSKTKENLSVCLHLPT